MFRKRSIIHRRPNLLFYYNPDYKVLNKKTKFYKIDFNLRSYLYRRWLNKKETTK